MCLETVYFLPLRVFMLRDQLLLWKIWYPSLDRSRLYKDE